MCVSRTWQSAILTMPSSHLYLSGGGNEFDASRSLLHKYQHEQRLNSNAGPFDYEHVNITGNHRGTGIAHSRLRRHIAHLSFPLTIGHYTLTSEDLQIITETMPHLRTLSVHTNAWRIGQKPIEQVDLERIRWQCTEAMSLKYPLLVFHDEVDNMLPTHASAPSSSSPTAPASAPRSKASTSSMTSTKKPMSTAAATASGIVETRTDIPFEFPPALQRLDLMLWSENSECLMQLLDAVSRLPSLHHLQLDVNGPYNVKCLSRLDPILKLSNLTCLILTSHTLELPDIVPVVRQMRQLQRLHLHNWSLVLQILQAGHQLNQLHTLNTHWSDELGEGLNTLDQLHSLILDKIVPSGCQLDGLLALRPERLRHLELRDIVVPPTGPRETAPPYLDWTQVWHTLQHCTHLTALIYRGEGIMAGRAEEIDACFKQMPHLQHLSIHAGRIDSLNFLSNGLLTTKLKTLRLSNIVPNLPQSHIKHIRMLTALEHLTLVNVFKEE
jgi:hypothetical protein